MGEVNGARSRQNGDSPGVVASRAGGSLRALLIQSRASLPAMAREMAQKGMISEEAFARLQETCRQSGGGSNGGKARVI